MIVGVTGMAGSGKDTFARRLTERHEFKKESFARRLKELCVRIFGWDMLGLDRLTYKEAPSNHSPIEWTGAMIDEIVCDQFENAMLHEEAGFHLFKILSAIQPDWTRRQILQWVGTEGFRPIDSEHWIKGTMHDVGRILRNFGARGVVIPDTRFPNEADAIRERNGIIVRVVREDQPTSIGAGHSSEQILTDVDYTVVAPGGQIQVLWDQADAIVETFK